MGERRRLTKLFIHNNVKNFSIDNEYIITTTDPVSVYVDNNEKPEEGGTVFVMKSGTKMEDLVSELEHKDSCVVYELAEPHKSKYASLDEAKESESEVMLNRLSIGPFFAEVGEPITAFNQVFLPWCDSIVYSEKGPQSVFKYNNMQMKDVFELVRKEHTPNSLILEQEHAKWLRNGSVCQSMIPKSDYRFELDHVSCVNFSSVNNIHPSLFKRAKKGEGIVIHACNHSTVQIPDLGKDFALKVHTTMHSQVRFNGIRFKDNTPLKRDKTSNFECMMWVTVVKNTAGGTKEGIAKKRTVIVISDEEEE